MKDVPLTGAQRTFLRGLGQRRAPLLIVGKAGLSPSFYAELKKALHAHELVKLRFLGADREERAARCAQIASGGDCACVGAVGHTALFYRRNPDAGSRRITFA